MPDQSIGYYLTKFFEFLQQAFIFVVSSTTGFYIFLSIVSIFFLFIMAYCGVRLIEITEIIRGVVLLLKVKIKKFLMLFGLGSRK